MYHPSGILQRAGTMDLVLKNDSYILIGSANYPDVIWDTNYREQSVIIATDTAGTEQWHYASSKARLYDCESDIRSGIATLDGGYMYVTCGNVYNKGTGVSIDLAGKTKIIKLDAARHKIWEQVVDKYFGNFGTTNAKLLELADSSFVLMGDITSDSTAPSYKDGPFVLAHYKADGSPLYSHSLKAVKDATDTTTSKISRSSAGCYDIIRTSDKGFLMAGIYHNNTRDAPLPINKGWLIKVDSNGCLGVGDSECWPTSIPLLGGVRGGLTLSVYPNPSSNYYELDYQNQDHSPATIAITDIIGRAIAQYPLPQGKSQIEATDWANGVYLYRLVQSGKTMYHGKLIKQ